MNHPILLLVTLFSFILKGLCISSSMQQEIVRTIKTKHGVFDCIDFYKQPAFSHPLLQNHTIKVDLVKLQKQKVVDNFGLKDGCPIGTVPIMRTNPNSYDVRQLPAFSSNDKLFHCMAVVRTKDVTQKFYGVDGSISLHKARAPQSQWSVSRVKLMNGNEAIEAGWMVSFDLYNDYEAHLYTIFSNGASRVQAPFVQVSKDFPLGFVPTKYTVPGQTPVYWNLSISKDTADGDWWLAGYGAQKYDIGYWPKQLFTTLAGAANQVDFGGEIDAGPTLIEGPDMGSGEKAIIDSNKSAFVAHVTVIDQDFKKNVVPQPTENYMTCEKYYTVIDAGYMSEYLGELIFFGGPRDPS